MRRPPRPLLRDNLCTIITIRVGAVILKIPLSLASTPGTKAGAPLLSRCL